ncbi:MAG: hypothetical protein ACR2HQ_13090 [Ilumatobacteraceae bacterium]
MQRIGNVFSSATSGVDLAGGWSWTVWLLIPVVLVLAILTARSLGATDDPHEAGARTTGGVSRFLARSDEPQGSPSATSTEGEKQR